MFVEAEKRAEAAAERKIKETAQRASFEQRKTDFETRAQEWARKEKVEDIDIIFDPSLPITQDMAQTLMDADNGPEVLHHLANNRDVARQIARLSPLQQARELGRLEARLANKPVAPKVSAAPPPAPKVEGTGDSGRLSFTPDSPDSDKLSTEEWLKRRNKQVARR